MSRSEAPQPMALNRLLAGFAAGELPETAIRGLTLDSRALRPGDLFAAVDGHQVHGLAFAEQALARGCAAIAYDPEGEGQRLALTVSAVPCVAVPDLGRQLGAIADRFFAEPSRALNVLGITGTNGKTSCSHFLAKALTESGEPAAVLGTLGWGRPGALAHSSHTTPDAIEIQRILFELGRQGFRAVAMEASSHGLEQGRLTGVRFRGALFTNFTRDHLDYHGSMEAYREAKLRLLEWPGLEFVVFNANDAIAGPIRERLPPGVRPLGFAVAGEPATGIPLLRVGGVRHSAEGLSFEACYEGRVANVEAPVFGDFNVENLTAALAVLLALGQGLEQAAAHLRGVRAIPGRMERYAAAGRTVVVDYAHTPDALRSVLGSLRRHCTGRLLAVFGCGGDRDRGKRPEMGAIATEIADGVVLTDDNPRNEEGDAIIREILAGCTGSPVIRRDRRAAIAHALQMAEPGDLVLVAGKGHEATQEVRGVKSDFSDRDVVRELLAHLSKHHP